MSIDLRQVGAVITMGLGVMSLLAPQLTARFTSIKPQGKIGISEIRATYGGFFIALGLGAIVLQSPVVFELLGLAWLAAAAGRVYSMVVDRSRSRKNLGGIAFEAVIGLLCLAGRL